MKSLALGTALLFAMPAFAQDTDPERVVMKLEDFLKLYETSRDRPKDPPAPPTPWSLASARYDGRVKFDEGKPTSALFDATMKVDVLAEEGWVKVPLLPATVALRSATIAGKDAAIVLDNGWYTLVTDADGVMDVKVSFAVSVYSAEGASGMAFQLAPSGATTMSLGVPTTENLDFTVAEARVQEEKVVGDMRVVEASVPSTGSLAVTWQREIAESAVQVDEPRIYAEVYTLVGVGDGLLQATSTVNHTILFAGVEQIKVGIPADMTLLDVRGAGIRDWRVAAGILEVDLNYAAQGAYPLTLELEKVIGSGDVSIEAPIPVPQGVERSKGFVGVEARGNLEIQGGEAVGATSVDVRNLPAAILGITTNPVLLGYKYLGTDAKIPLQVTEHEDVDVLVTLLDQARATTMWTIDGRRMTSVKYQVRNNRKQYLRMTLPAGATLWSASLGGRAVQPAQAADGQVLLPLVRSSALGGSLAAFEVEVVYIEEGTKPSEAGSGTFTATLPSVDVPATYVAWTVFTPIEAKIPKSSIESTMRHVDWLSNPIASTDVRAVSQFTPDMMAGAAGQADGGSFGDGATPVPVSLPLSGNPVYFEKLLALQEPLEVSFDFKGLKE